MSQCYCDYLHIYNTETGEKFKPFCKSYNCPVHGKRNLNILKSKIEYEVSTWESVKMWTFTLSSKYFPTPVDHFAALNKMWRYFVTYIRRSNVLSKKQRKFKYIRVPEMHKSGYYHFHVLVDTYLDFHLVYGLWNAFAKLFCKTEDYIGGCHVSFIPNSVKASRYVVKYVSKTLQVPDRPGRIYTKSVGIRFFRKRKNQNTFACYDSLRDRWFGLYPFFSLLVSHSTVLHNNYQQYLLFDLPSPP